MKKLVSYNKNLQPAADIRIEHQPNDERPDTMPGIKDNEDIELV